MNEAKSTVFLSYASEDRNTVAKVYDLLAEDSRLALWFDQESLIGGENWEATITDRLSQVDFVVFFLSRQAEADQNRFFQREIRLAQVRAEQLPVGQRFIIPVLLEEFQPKREFSEIHWVRLYDPDGMDQLKRALSPSDATDAWDRITEQKRLVEEDGGANEADAETDARRIDASKPLSAEPQGLGEPPAEWEIKANELVGNRALFITSKSDKQLFAAGYRVANHPIFAKSQRRILQGPEAMRATDFAELILNQKGVYGADGDLDKPVVLLVVVSNLQFLNSIVKDWSLIITQQSELRRMRIALVFLMGEAVRRTVEFPPAGTDFEEFHWDIPVVDKQSTAEGTVDENVLIDVLESGAPAEKAAMFVGGFFARQRRADFDFLLEILLKDQVQPIEREAGATLDPEGEVQSRRTEMGERPAIDQWRETKRTIIAKVGLQMERDGDQRLISYSGREDLVRDVLWDDFDYPIEAFLRLHREGLLFKEDLSESINLGMMALAMEVGAQAPNRFGANWLSSLVKGFISAHKELWSNLLGDSPLIAQIVDQIGDKLGFRYQNLFYGQMSSLCGSLYSVAGTRGNVETFLANLLERRDYRTYWKLVQKLRRTPSFDFYRSVRELIRSSPTPDNQIVRQVFEVMAKQAAISAESCEEVVRQVYEWLPRQKQKQESKQDETESAEKDSSPADATDRPEPEETKAPEAVGDEEKPADTAACSETKPKEQAEGQTDPAENAQPESPPPATPNEIDPLAAKNEDKPVVQEERSFAWANTLSFLVQALAESLEELGQRDVSGRQLSFTMLGADAAGRPSERWLTLLRDWLLHPDFAVGVARYRGEGRVRPSRWIKESRQDEECQSQQAIQYLAKFLELWHQAAAMVYSDDPRQTLAGFVFQSLSHPARVKIKEQWVLISEDYERGLEEISPFGSTAQQHATLKRFWKTTMALRRL